MLILTNIDILVIELDLMEKDIFHIQLLKMEKDVIIFGEDMSSSTRTDIDILILAKGPTQRLEHTLICLLQKKGLQLILANDTQNFVGACFIMEQIVICLLIVKKFVNSKQNILRLQQLHYVQETLQKTGQQIKLKKTGFNRYVYDFSLDYDAIAVDDILDIHKYLMKKNIMI